MHMVIVGGNSEYYRLKNSLGTMWGENGYIRIASRENNCGVCEYVYYPNMFKEG